MKKRVVSYVVIIIIIIAIIAVVLGYFGILWPNDFLQINILFVG